jgi:uncharacterized protein (DUF58 family)
MTLLLGFSAVNTGNNLLYFIFASLLAFMSVTGLAGWLNLRGIRAELHLPAEIYRHRPVQMTIFLHNRKRLLPSFLLETRLMGETGLIATISRRGSETAAVTVRFGDRGDIAIGSVTVASRYPINFFVRWLTVPVATVVTVFPEPLPVPLPSAADRSAVGAVRAVDITGLGGEVKRIGDYTGREPLRQVHWRLSARHGELKVKELEELSGPPVLLDLERLPGAGLEERLSAATHLVNLLCRQGRSVGLRTGAGLIPAGNGSRHRLRLLRELARHGTL